MLVQNIETNRCVDICILNHYKANAIFEFLIHCSGYIKICKTKEIGFLRFFKKFVERNGKVMQLLLIQDNVIYKK